MDLLMRTSFFLWIAVGFLSIAAKSKAYADNQDTRYNATAQCKHVFGDVCYEFVEESKNWSQARCACVNRGGQLLNLMTSTVKSFLQSDTIKMTTNHTWWLGDGVLNDASAPEFITESGDVLMDNSSFPCTYMALDPLQLVATSDCDQKHGYLCTLDLTSLPRAKRAAVSSNATKSRVARNAVDQETLMLRMESSVGSIEELLLAADEILYNMEMNTSEPTDTNRDDFIKHLLAATKQLEPKFVLDNNETVSHILNCSGGILLLSLKKCTIETNPNPVSLFERIFEIYRVVGLLLSQATGETVVIRHATGVIYQTSFTPSQMDNAVMGSEKDGAYIKLPSFSALQSQLGQYETVNAQLATFNINPHPSNENITGTVCKLSLSDGSADIHITNLPEPIEIYLGRTNASEPVNATIAMENGSPILSSFNVSDPNVTIFMDVEPNTNVSLLLQLSYGSPPNSTYYSSSTILNQTGGYRWIVTPDMLEDGPGVWYVKTVLYNSTWTPGLTLDYLSFTSKCMFWSVQKEIWSIDGCTVGELSTPDRTQCLCDHLTLFGSSFFVMPNYVDLSRTAELFATVSKNYVVLALLCAFFGLYLITLMWACYADRRALARRKMTLLEDNHPCAQYNYLLSVQTGHRKNSGTSANVTVKLIGADGESETQNLTDPDKPVFERGAVDMFMLAAPFPLGELRTIRLQHDNSGGSPAWYINKVAVRDLQTQQVWQFFCECWLSSDQGDGVTKKTFSAAKKNEIACFRNIFQTRTSTGFRDEHIWVSIVDPPWRSPFTRAQRVSCCMSLLLCTMAINIAFWNIPKDATSTVLLSIGSLEITWQEIMVGVQSGLLMFPINILIITIFRSIKPRVTSKSNKNSSAQKPQALTIPTILKETEELVNLLSRSPRNKVSEMTERMETSSDLPSALNRIHELIQLMQGESESNPHWVYCSRFILCCLYRLLLCLEKLDGKNFQSPDEYQEALNTTNLLIRKTEMVFSSHSAYCPPPVSRKKKAGGCRLPWWFVFLGWFLLLSISGVSTFFTLLYGFQYGKQKSIQWVISLGMSLFQSIFILQPLKVVGLAVFFALLLKPVAVEETEENDQLLSEQREKRTQYSGRNSP